MSIVFGSKTGMTLLDVTSVTSKLIPDAAKINQVDWILCYSGFSRELVNSGFNTRVQECEAAAARLQPNARTLSQVLSSNRIKAKIDALPKNLAGRARHYFSETARVEQGVTAWRAGNWSKFGTLMNESCHSSITQYESGSQPMIDLHEIASDFTSVYGSRFCGGGYGGCLLMLVDREHSADLQQNILERYIEIYPEKNRIARISKAKTDDSVRVI